MSAAVTSTTCTPNSWRQQRPGSTVRRCGRAGERPARSGCAGWRAAPRRPRRGRPRPRRGRRRCRWTAATSRCEPGAHVGLLVRGPRSAVLPRRPEASRSGRSGAGWAAGNRDATRARSRSGVMRPGRAPEDGGNRGARRPSHRVELVAAGHRRRVRWRGRRGRARAAGHRSRAVSASAGGCGPGRAPRWGRVAAVTSREGLVDGGGECGGGLESLVGGRRRRSS